MNNRGFFCYSLPFLQDTIIIVPMVLDFRSFVLMTDLLRTEALIRHAAGCSFIISREPHFCDKFTYQLQIAGALCGSLKKNWFMRACAMSVSPSAFFRCSLLVAFSHGKVHRNNRDVSAGSSIGMKRANDRFKRKSATRPQNSYRSN